jgi:hypothetical protein
LIGYRRNIIAASVGAPRGATRSRAGVAEGEPIWMSIFITEADFAGLEEFDEEEC